MLRHPGMGHINGLVKSESRNSLTRRHSKAHALGSRLDGGFCTRPSGFRDQNPGRNQRNRSPPSMPLRRPPFRGVHVQNRPYRMHKTAQGRDEPKLGLVCGDEPGVFRPHEGRTPCPLGPEAGGGVSSKLHHIHPLRHLGPQQRRRHPTERRSSVTQYSSSGLIRWAAFGHSLQGSRRCSGRRWWDNPTRMFSVADIHGGCAPSVSPEGPQP